MLDVTEAYASDLAGRRPVQAIGEASTSVGDDGTMLAVTSGGSDALQMTATRRPMPDMIRAVVASGPGRGASLPGFIAGKTGTFQDNRDA